MMKIQCPKCKQVLQVPDTSAGKAIRCPRCGQTMSLRPAAAAVAAPPAAAAPPLAAVAPKPAPPPPRPAPAADVTGPPPADFPELGRVVKEYRPRRYWIGLAPSAALLVIALPLTIVASVMDVKVLIAPTAILTIASAGLTVIFGVYTLASLKRWVSLRENGFVSYGLFGTVACPWPEVAAMYVIRAGLSPTTELRFDLEGGKNFVLLWVVPNQDDLADRVAAATTPLIQARVEAALARGEAVDFGIRLRADPEGMLFRPNGPKGASFRARWKDVTSMVLGRYQTTPGATGLAGAHVQTQLVVHSSGNPPWIIASANIGNFPIFLDVLEKRFGVQIEKP